MIPNWSLPLAYFLTMMSIGCVLAIVLGSCQVPLR